MQFEQDFPRRLKRTKRQWKNFLVKITLWLIAEIWLGYVGMDDLADYSEFIFERHIIRQPPLTSLT